MAEVVEVDRSGRIVIPKSLRREMQIKDRTRFIVAKRGEGQLLLQKLDVDEIARRLEIELAGRDVDAIVKTVRKEIDRKIKEQYPDLLA
jgi:AbrB family looped-hinge helix DNA binding protein